MPSRKTSRSNRASDYLCVDYADYRQRRDSVMLLDGILATFFLFIATISFVRGLFWDDVTYFFLFAVTAILFIVFSADLEKIMIYGRA